jgi:hypothetical protein
LTPFSGKRQGEECQVTTTKYCDLHLEPIFSQSVLHAGNMVLHMSTNNGGAKTVRFAAEGDLCDYRSGLEELTEEMEVDIWYQLVDFARFRASARESCDDAIKKGLSAYLKRTYGYSDNKTQDLLTLWAKCRETGRGLERFISEDYSKHRMVVRRKTVRAVLYTQDRLRKENEDTYYDRAAVIIGNVATTLSYNAVQFAIMLGKADYAAVTQRRVTAATVRRATSVLVRKLSQSPVKHLRGGSDHSPTVPAGLSPRQRRGQQGNAA